MLLAYGVVAELLEDSRSFQIVLHTTILNLQQVL